MNGIKNEISAQSIVEEAKKLANDQANIVDQTNTDSSANSVKTTASTNPSEIFDGSRAERRRRKAVKRQTARKERRKEKRIMQTFWLNSK